MKQLLREYLAQLKEREELDAILPDLLSEHGFHVYSRPQRGTTQHGVDIAAVGKDPEDGQSKVYLFSVKRGDLTRQDWDQGDQALRPSLNQIRDAYIPTKVPAKYAGLPIVICLVFGGVIREQIQTEVRGYIRTNTTPTLTYEEWNGDKLAEMILEGVLRERVLPTALQTSFRKAIALVDEPDVAYRHFASLVRQMRQHGMSTRGERVTAARQLSICCWIMFVWGRSSGNIEAPYRAVELALLSVWDIIKPSIGTRGKEVKELNAVLAQLVQLHLSIASELIDLRITPLVEFRDAVATAVGGNDLDINLALFDLLGRIAMTGHWTHWLQQHDPGYSGDRSAIDHYISVGIKLIEKNTALILPVSDKQATSVALFLLLWIKGSGDRPDVRPWLTQMARRYKHILVLQRRYPTCKTSYRDLLAHPVDRTDAYFQEATAASTLMPLLVIWARALGLAQVVNDMRELVARKLTHCTMQLWSVDETSEAHLYINDEQHGRAVVGLPVGDPDQIIAVLEEVRLAHPDLEKLSAIRAGWWPIVLTACRHWEIPVPTDFYSPALALAIAPDSAPGDDARAAPVS
jgi:hypothetical protein